VIDVLKFGFEVEKMMRAFLVFMFAAFSCAQGAFAASQKEVDDMIENVHWLGHDAFRVDGPKALYFDPWKLSKGAKKADIIFVSHEHFDHCSPDDIRRISTEDTVIVCDKGSSRKLGKEIACKEIKAVSAGDAFDVDGIRVEAVPAYNVNKEFHPKSKGMVGYIVTVGGVRLYHAGDTDFIPEMKTIQCDIALLPVSGIYVMTADEAAGAALAIKPKLAVPMHYGDVAGSPDDAREFQDLLKGKVEVKILQKE
jgi:L-ascorbate metabolism protein UlaG (beta-lactamase superfamily)